MMMSGLPLNGTYQLNVIKLSTHGYRTTGTTFFDPNVNSDEYPYKASYNIGKHGNSVYAGAEVTFTQVNSFDGGSNPAVIISCGGHSKTVVISAVKYSDNGDNRTVLIQDSQTHDWYVLSSDNSVLNWEGDHVSHYWSESSVFSSGDDGPFFHGDEVWDSVKDGGSGQFTPCYLAGTLIRTDKGDKTVEMLSIGDRVVVLVDGREELRDITWIGESRVKIRPLLPDDSAGYPVRVKKNALADGLPSQDLLITPEHCLFFDGFFVPARMLVNGLSILYDRLYTSFTIYHVETQDHSVIYANDVPAESYLDTGNRSQFRQKNDKILALPKSGEKSWDTESAAPLVTDRDRIEPLFKRLEQRALMRAGLPLHGPEDTALTTREPDLHLVTRQGEIIRPKRRNGEWWVFPVPPDVKSVYLASRADRPCDAIGPFVDDRRTLGVLVGDVTLYASNQAIPLETYRVSDTLAGWHGQENPTLRWTNGFAELPLPHRRRYEFGMLAIRVLDAGSYRLQEENDRHQSEPRWVMAG